MAIKALNPFEPYWFTPASEEDESSPTRFQVKGLNGLQMSQVSPEIRAIDDGNDAVISAKGVRLIMKYGLIDWENFENDKGPVKHSPNVDKNMEMIPVQLQKELALEILYASQVREEDKKKSESQ